jgi:hypothetical protein
LPIDRQIRGSDHTARLKKRTSGLPTRWIFAARRGDSLFVPLSLTETNFTRSDGAQRISPPPRTFHLLMRTVHGGKGNFK